MSELFFFDGEEPGHFAKYLGYGSQHFCQEFGDSEEIKLAYIIDMVGGPLVNQNIGFTLGISNINHDLLQQRCSEIKNQAGYDFGITVVPEHDRMNASSLTDSAYFKDLGAPTLLLSNIAGLHLLPSFYHTEQDTIDIIDWQSFLNSIDISEALLRKEDWY